MVTPRRVSNQPRPAPARGLAALTALVLACCSFGRPDGRTGPPFAEAFPDASILVSTDDPEAVRRELANAQLPETQAHHDELVRLLHGQDRISAAHLLLLVEAVARPSDRVVYLGDGTDVHVYAARGEGPFAHITEQLYVDALDKVTDVDRRTFGALIAHTQSNATMAAYAERFLPELDDGSLAALEQVLEPMAASPAKSPFLIDYLAPHGRLDGPRGWALVGTLSFDSERLELLAALASRHDAIDGAQVAEAVDRMSFDDGRGQALALLAPKARPVSGRVAEATVGEFSFDTGRIAAVATLADTGALALDDRGLVAIVRLCSFDSGRTRCVEILAPCLHGEPDGASARALLDAFSFDSGRLSACETMAERWRGLGPDGQRELLSAFTFSSSREQARALLAR